MMELPAGPTGRPAQDPVFGPNGAPGDGTAAGRTGAGPAGRLYAGTSGFAYPGWAPRFYPPGLPPGRLLAAYATRLATVELNNTFYRRPTPDAIATWLAATPPDFRFCPKAQRGSCLRAFRAEDPGEAIAWLAAWLAGFGERLGPVLVNVPATIQRDDRALTRMLAAWPAELPLALQLVHPSWEDDEVFAALSERGAAMVAVDRDGYDEPDLRRSGGSLYLRLRRAAYAPDDLARWAARLRPFLDDGIDAYVFLRHDEDGVTALQAEALAALVAGSVEGRRGRE